MQTPQIYWVSKESYKTLERHPPKSTTSKLSSLDAVLQISYSTPSLISTSKNRNVACTKKEKRAVKSQNALLKTTETAHCTCTVVHESRRVATEDRSIVGGGGGWSFVSAPPVTIDNPPFLRPCTRGSFFSEHSVTIN